ncbi:MAG TPA: hypothetical protein VHZ04_00860 [Candidatus Paceibacterota bacterium]|jgi:hypothetical protein|nr:hypothetical protein [Candidatus Paceibacterota bacterium]
MATNFHYKWRRSSRREKFLTGVSLHGHTWHSKENLGFLPDFAEKVSPFARLLARAEASHEKKWGEGIDYRYAYWTSPISPEDAYLLEAKQVEKENLSPLVSLSDHDETAANEELIDIHKKNVPISLEWSVPYKKFIFHVGVHNLPRAKSASLLAEMRAFTAKPDGKVLADILARLHKIPEVLIVLNHPLTDQGRIGREIPVPVVDEFLAHYGKWMHALEVNALQSWETNRRVMVIAERIGLPLISGGDRHGLEPSGMINLTNARTFQEFVHEIRDEKKSDILLMPQSRKSLFVRYAGQISEIVDRYPALKGREFWHDRVFYTGKDGVTRSLTEMSAPDSPSLAAVNQYLKLLDLAMAGFVKPISPFLARTKESDIS